ncbi:MAG: L-threonylcarbamoyladenylate synthase, partial [Planctomycetota bacterium]
MAPIVIHLRKAEDSRDIVHRAVQALSEGKLVVFPTETVYGVGASARSNGGVARIFGAKGRPDQEPLALVVRGVEDALDYAPRMGPRAERLARRCWPGPVTLVVASGQEGLVTQLPPDVQQAVAPSGEVGLRSPAHEIVYEVMQMLVGPIALTSANRSGAPPAATADQAVRDLGGDVAVVLDDGPCRYGQPSTVVRVDQSGFHCLREGVVPLSAIQRHASMLILIVCTGNTCRSPMAEGV